MKREIMAKQGISDSGKLSPLAVLTAGGLAGMANWAVAIPPDVLKSKYQTASPGTYNGIYDVFQEVIREEGYSGLFRGLRPALIRAFPANAACFFGMELSRSLLAFMD
jgi:solute carrier family 25 carnitine/acylcarnitine transporter 20/29